MKTSSFLRLALALFAGFSSAATGPASLADGCPNCSLAAVDWTTLPSTFTHRDGAAVDQFQAAEVPTTHSDALRQTSVYRHHRSSLQGNNSVDHYHRVDEYGPPVRPYGEWRYPYRPYSVPYGAWGPQLPQFYTNANVYGFGRAVPPAFGAAPAVGMNPNGWNAQPGFAQPNWNGAPGLAPHHWNGGMGGGLIPGPANALPAQSDEYYPDAPEPRPMSDRDFFYTPMIP